MATLTKKDLLEAIEDMPMDTLITMFHGCFYIPVEFVQIKQLWVNGKQVECICIEPQRTED